MKLLLVDDHAGARALIRECAALPADEVRECASGEAAVAALRDFVPDWVTLDVVMAGMTGFAALREMRALCPSARIVLVSTYNDLELQGVALAFGAVAFVPKDQLPRLFRMIADARAGTDHR